MADEGSSQSGGGSGASMLKKWGPLAAIVLLAEFVLAWVVLQLVFKDRIAEEEYAPSVAGEVYSMSTTEHSPLPYPYTSPALKSIAANPAGTQAQRFVMFSLTLGLVG